jgi:hypothetical protein
MSGEDLQNPSSKGEKLDIVSLALTFPGKSFFIILIISLPISTPPSIFYDRTVAGMRRIPAWSTDALQEDRNWGNLG